MVEPSRCAIATLVGQGGPAVADARQVFELAEAGDPAAIQVVAEVVGSLGDLGVDVGGAARPGGHRGRRRVWPTRASALLVPLEARLTPSLPYPPRLVASALEDAAVLHGAVSMALTLARRRVAGIASAADRRSIAPPWRRLIPLQGGPSDVPHHDALEAAYLAAQEVIAGGVNSGARGPEAGWVPGPPVVARGEGSHLWDVDGNEYIDYLLALGPMIHGHRHPEVTERVSRAIHDDRDDVRAALRAGGRGRSRRSSRRSRRSTWSASATPGPRSSSTRRAWPGRSPAATSSSASRASTTAGPTSSNGAITPISRPRGSARAPDRAAGHAGHPQGHRADAGRPALERPGRGRARSSPSAARRSRRS